MILTNSSKEEVINYWNKIIRKIDRHEYSPLEIGYPEQITNTFKTDGNRIIECGYKITDSKTGKLRGLPSHLLSALYSNAVLNTEWEAETKPIRIPIDKDKLVSKPKFFTWSYRGQEKTDPVKNISVESYYDIPEEYYNAIDWERVKSRLRKKIKKIFDLCSWDMQIDIEQITLADFAG